MDDEVDPVDDLAIGNPIGSTPRASASIDEFGREDVVEGPQNSARLPAYVSLDLRIDKIWVGDWGAFAVFLDGRTSPTTAIPRVSPSIVADRPRTP